MSLDYIGNQHFAKLFTMFMLHVFKKVSKETRRQGFMRQTPPSLRLILRRVVFIYLIYISYATDLQHSCYLKNTQVSRESSMAISFPLFLLKKTLT